MSARTDCLNCDNTISHEGDAFCTTCEPHYMMVDSSPVKIQQKTIPDNMSYWRKTVNELSKKAASVEDHKLYMLLRSLMKRINSPYILTDKQKRLIEKLKQLNDSY